jgi:hypothetical protein
LNRPVGLGVNANVAAVNLCVVCPVHGVVAVLPITQVASGYERCPECNVSTETWIGPPPI